MKQQTIITESYYGETIKSVLTTFGPKKYSVAYFDNSTDLVAKESADFTKLSDAMFSINAR